MPAELSEKELSEFREIFNLVDADGSGRITQHELRSLMEVLRLKPTEEELYDMFAEAKGITTTTTATAAAAAAGATTSATNAAVAGASLGGRNSMNTNSERSILGLSGLAGVSATSHPTLVGAGGSGGAVSASASSASATIDFHQFVAIMSKRVQSEYTPEQLRNAFKLFETEDLPIGTVSTEVLEHALMTYGSEKLSQEEAVRLLAAVDPEGTGKVNYTDFVSLVTGEEK